MIAKPGLLVLGGTSDSIELANKLYMICKDTVLSTATEYGSHISTDRFSGEVACGKKDAAQLKEFILEKGIKIVVDATHPYAAGISQNAMDACRELEIDYARYERDSGIHRDSAIQDSHNIIYCSSYEEAAAIADGKSGNILVTTGSNNIDKLAAGIRDKKRLKIRVLPVSESVRRLEQAGFNADNIIAMKGPFSEEMNYLMMVENDIRLMISKDSGEPGGTDEKLRAARRCGAEVIIIKRPQLEYPNKFASIEAVAAFVEQKLAYTKSHKGGTGSMPLLS